MFRGIPNELKLWQHQREALKFLIDHLNKAAGPCLVRMPTGTGKTGVIACVSMLSAPGRTLVLTPWSNLRDQMVDALSGAFWSSLGSAAPSGKVLALLPSTADAVLKATDVKVFVSTFSTLTDLRRSHEPEYHQLADFVDTVIVDECHYEPALEWGKAVKGLGKSTVLFTATPYRNDLKLFRIRDIENSVIQFTHQAAEANKIIRPLIVQPLTGPMDIPALSHAFAATWKAAYAANQLISPSPRAIICCASATDIRQAVLHLRSAGLDAIGIHEAFEGKMDGTFVKDVPSLESSATVWVHQHKLTEGLDDHRFSCLAFFCQINTDRKLVQQIGRILRTSASDREGASALMLSPPAFKLGERWLAYREFEQDADLQSAEHYRRVVERLLEGQPAVEYFDGRFRRRFRPDVLTEDPQVAIAPSVLVRAVDSDFTLSDYVEDCTDSLNLTDAIILGEPDKPCQQSAEHALWVYASVGNSRLLEDTSLYEVRLEAHCAVLHAGYLLVSDTTGTYPDALIEQATSGLGAAELSRLMDDTYRVTNVAVSSAVPFDTVLRASEHRGHNLSRVPASLTDRIQICRSARGASSSGRRYLGLHRGRVREELPERTRRQHSVSTFRAWAKSIAGALTAVRSSHPVLQRYMQTCNPPANPVPVAMSVDLSHPSLGISGPHGNALQIAESSVPVRTKPGAATRVYACTFEFIVEVKPDDRVAVELLIEYQPSKGRFWFRSRDQQGVLVEETADTHRARKSFVDFLNQNQDLMLIGLEGGGLVYQGRNFYAVDYAHAERELLQRIIRPDVQPCGSEKGSSAEIELAKTHGATAFIAGSLFKLIAEGDLPFGFVPELIVCDDLGSECADFVVANFTQRHLALVHAKTGTGTKISASAFHDIVSQAMKNLVYLSRNDEQPKQVTSWTPGARWNNTNIPRLYRHPVGCPTGADLWRALRNDIANTANPQLHVVLVTTGCCDRDALLEAAQDPSARTAETAQLIHLLDGLVGYARQLGVQVSIFDVPYRPPATTTVPKSKGKQPAAKRPKQVAKKRQRPAKVAATRAA